MQLSAHFDQKEFEKDAPVPAACVPVLQFLCLMVLEPIRGLVARPMEITSGYRPPDANKAAHGVPNSEHVYTEDHAAADFTFDTMIEHLPPLSIRACFDWIRNNPLLPFDQVILEHGASGSSIIHVSCSKQRLEDGVRSALEGATHNASVYTKWEVATYVEPEPTTGENA